MKTAKKLCEEIKNKPNIVAENIAKKYIELLQQYNGKYLIHRFYVNYGHYIIDGHKSNDTLFINQDYLELIENELAILKLKELGYKVEEKISTVMYYENANEYKTIPEIKFLGLTIKKESKKLVSYNRIKKEQECKVIEISACCGEE